MRCTRRAALLFLLMCAAMLLGACSTQMPEPIKVMSFNIRYDDGEPSGGANVWVSTAGEHRRGRALAVVSEYRPDILGVQEALHNQIIDLQHALPGYGFAGVGRDDGKMRGEYSAVFFRSDRFTKNSEGTFWLSETPEVPGSKYPETCCARIASWVVLEDTQTAGNPRYLVLNTHWEHNLTGQPAREYSAGMIRGRIASLSGGRPLIVMGDLNADEENVAVTSLLGSRDATEPPLMDSYRAVFPTRDPNERTFHAFDGGIDGSRIDYILFSDGFTAEDAAIIHTDFDGRFPSDHYPVTAVLLPVR